MKTMLRNATLLLLIACMLGGTVTLSGCTVSIKAQELSAGYVRTATAEGEVTDAFVAAMADFAMTLTNTTIAHDREETGKANHLVSPLSAMICLSVLANGAKGETLTQMEAVLGMSIGDLNRALYAYTSNLYVGEDCKVSVADSIWYREGFAVREEFLQTCADWYAARQYAAPFDEQTRRDINAWVKKYTDGMIESILAEPILDTVVMYVINALVFDAKWAEEYETDDVRKGQFTTSDGVVTAVEMMHSTEGTYLTVEGGYGVARPYKGRAYSFVGLLPEEGTDVYEFAAGLTGETWVAMWRGRTGETVHTRIPEFTYASDMTLTPVLQEMGMTRLFEGMAADLSGIAGDPGDLYCSGVFQKTFIEVNRHGTKAAAVTWGQNECTSAAPVEARYVYLDRPFVYAIVDNATGLPLFVGVMTEPGQ